MFFCTMTLTFDLEGKRYIVILFPVVKTNTSMFQVENTKPNFLKLLLTAKFNLICFDSNDIYIYMLIFNTSVEWAILLLKTNQFDPAYFPCQLYSSIYTTFFCKDFSC